MISGFGTTFVFTAPTDELPSNVQLIGLDGRFFTVSLSATAPNGNGVRNVTIQIYMSSPLDFEIPADENRDNVYTFRLSGVYRGETLTTDITVTITDILDAASSTATIILGEATNQIFGAPIISIPDLTGDGKPEIGVSVQSGLGPASAYIISSEFYGSVSSGSLNISSLGSGGARFQQTPVTTAPPSLNRAFAQQSLRANLLTALPAASGTGTEILLSDAQRKKMYLWKLSAPADFNALRGNIDPDAVPNTIVYSFDPSDPAKEGRLIGDVNGDGINDIFVQPVRRTQTSGTKFGIIFGRPASAGLARTDAFDIELTTPNYLGEAALPYLVVQFIADADRDGNRELVISAPAVLGLLSDQSLGVFWVIRSGVLRAGGFQSVNLDTITAAQGIRISAGFGFNFLEVDDLDADGLKSLLVVSGSALSGSIGRVVDGDDLLAAGGFAAGRLVQLPFAPQSYFGPVGNLDGDAVDDFVSNPGPGNLAIVVRGGPIKSGYLTAPAEVPGSQQIDFRRVSYAQIEARSPAYLKESGLVAFGIASQDGINGVATGPAQTSGRIVLVKEADIRRSVTAPSTGLEIQ